MRFVIHDDCDRRGSVHCPLSESVPLNLPDPLHARQPTHTVLIKLLHSRSQLRLMQTEIVHGANAQNALSRHSRADTIHERAARGTEVVGHGIAGADGARLAEGLQVVAAAQVREVGVGDGEVGCEHGCGNFVAVGAIADEGVD